MEQSERKKLKEGLELFLNEGLERLTLSHPADLQPQPDPAFAA